MLFRNRVDAGRRLAEQLQEYARHDVVVVGLPRGGVPVAFEVASALGAPLDVIMVRKLGVPFQRELAMGAVGEGGVRVINDDLVHQARVTAQELSSIEGRERAEMDRRATRYRGSRPPVPLAGRIVVIVDDGVATGSTARAACAVARAQGARRVVLAVPVAPTDEVAGLLDCADAVVCVEAIGEQFVAVGQSYADFAPVRDAEVADLLDRAAHRGAFETLSPVAAEAEPATPSRTSNQG